MRNAQEALSVNNDLVGIFNWINWLDPIQADWATRYFTRKANRPINSSWSILHWYQSVPEHSRTDLLRKSKNAWAAKSSRNTKELQAKKPVQVHLSKEARDYLTKTAKIVRKTKSELIESIIKDQLTLHHKIMMENKKLKKERKDLLNQFQRVHLIEMSRIEQAAKLKEEIAELRAIIADSNISIHQ
jgi:hypothetical protein